MNPCSGWLFDLYAHPEKGVVFWLLGDDEKPHCFFDRGFEVTFYASGAVSTLPRALAFPEKEESKAAVHPAGRPVLRDAGRGGGASPHPATYSGLFKEVNGHFPDLVFYDTDIPLPLRFAAARDVFMMGHCEVNAQADGQLESITSSDTPAELDPKLPRFRKLNLRPDADPAAAPSPAASADQIRRFLHADASG